MATAHLRERLPFYAIWILIFLQAVSIVASKWLDEGLGGPQAFTGLSTTYKVTALLRLCKSLL